MLTFYCLTPLSCLLQFPIPTLFFPLIKLRKKNELDNTSKEGRWTIGREVISSAGCGNHNQNQHQIFISKRIVSLVLILCSFLPHMIILLYTLSQTLRHKTKTKISLDYLGLLTLELAGLWIYYFLESVENKNKNGRYLCLKVSVSNVISIFKYYVKLNKLATKLELTPLGSKSNKIETLIRYTVLLTNLFTYLLK